MTDTIYWFKGLIACQTFPYPSPVGKMMTQPNTEKSWLRCQVPVLNEYSCQDAVTSVSSATSRDLRHRDCDVEIRTALQLRYVYILDYLLTLITFLKVKSYGLNYEMTHQLRAIASFPKDMNSNPTALVAHTASDSSSRDSVTLFWPLRALSTHMVPRHTCRQYPPATHKIINEKLCWSFQCFGISLSCWVCTFLALLSPP